MRRDERVFIMGEDIGPYGGAFKVTRDLIDEFGPKRVRNTPISEAAIIGTATGAALTGTRPVAEIMYVDFTTLGMDQIVNQMAKIRYCSWQGNSTGCDPHAGRAGRWNAAAISKLERGSFMYGIYVSAI